MLQKKFWIPVVLVLIGFAIGGTFVGHHIASQEPVKAINAVTPEPAPRSQPAAPKPPPPGETYETGHWHGDEWHAEPHETVVEVPDVPVEDYRDVELEAYEASLSHFTEEERATYDRALTGEITRHREKYPDCQDHEAVFEDADQFSRWYVADKAYRKKRRALYEEWEKIAAEKDEFFDNFYLNMSAEERAQYVKNMSDAEKASFIAELEDWEKRKTVAFQRYDEVDQEKPIEPKRRHTH